jgi:hypothetical protein
MFHKGACRSTLEKLLEARFAAKRASFGSGSPASPLIVFTAIPDAGYYAIMGEILCGLRQHMVLRVEQLDTLSLRPGAGRSFFGFLQACLSYNPLTQRKWERLHAAFADRLGYRSTGWSTPLQAWRRHQHARQLWKALRSNDDLAALEYGGIRIGDLVIDTYLRFRPCVSINLADRYLLMVIASGLKDVDIAFAYFRRARPAAFLTIYASYLQHGVPVRVAVACGTKTVLFGNLQEFATAASADHLVHTKASAGYAQGFAALPRQDEKLEAAAQALEMRLSGGIDPATAYMKKSAYAVTLHEVPDVRGAAVIFLHDFYDSLHIYSWTLFHDFWDWVCTTIDALEDAGQPFWIKPHPNQNAQSSAEIAALRRRYPNSRFLPPEITNRQLADAGMACAITVYGSVAPEMAFMGVPSISSGASPHVSFGAFGLARNRSDYRRMLAAIPGAAHEKDQLRRQACAFYHMHNLNMPPEDATARDRFATAWAHMLGGNPQACLDPEKIGNVLTGMTETPGFARFCETLFPENHP